jgi:recombinational DNA repair protein (RecF pathway)
MRPKIPCAGCGKATRADAISYLRRRYLCPRCVRALTPAERLAEARTPPDAGNG